MNRIILHIDFNSYFATVEQQANPRLRGKPIGVTGGDRMTRTVLGAASVEAKKFGVKTGMKIYEARALCPQLILVPGDSDKYLTTTKRFLNILKDYSPYLEVFSIDECFLQMTEDRMQTTDNPSSVFPSLRLTEIANEIKARIKSEVGEWITCSIGISYNKIMAKLAGSLIKPDGLVIIANEEEAQAILDKTPLDQICGIGHRIKRRLLNMGITNFKTLRKASKETLLIAFKSYGENLYNWSRGLDYSPVTPFYEEEEVKSIGHRHTHFRDMDNIEDLKQVFLKICEMIAKRARDKKLVGKTVSIYFRYQFEYPYLVFEGDGMQLTIAYTQDGLEIFEGAFRAFLKLWNGRSVRMIGITLSNLKPYLPTTISFLPEVNRRDIILDTLDKVNNRFGDFTLQRGVLLTSPKIKRKPNPFLADRRFKI